MDRQRTRIVSVAILTCGGLVAGMQHAASGDVSTYADSEMVGMNVPGLSNQSSSWTLSNYYLSAGDWNYFPAGTVSFTTQGDPILKVGQSAGQNVYYQNPNNAYDLSGTLDSKDYPAGTYTVTWTGTGSLDFSGDTSQNYYFSSVGNETSTTNSRTFTVNPGSNGLYLLDGYQQSGPFNSTNDPIENIHVYAPGYAPGQANAGQTFTQPFTQGLNPFGTLRFMDAMNTNSDKTVWTSLATSSSPGPQTSDETWTGSAGMPIAAMVSLANQTHTNPWFNIPAYASASYVTQFAQYVKANLNPGLKVYVEYGNEDWSSLNPAGQRIASQSGGATNGPVFDANWAADDEAVFKDWESVYTGSSTGVSSQLVRVAALQTSNSYDSPMFLTSLKAAGGFDAVADAPYFGPSGSNIASYSSSTTAQQILNDMIADIHNEASGDWALNKTWANLYGVPLIGYEGGQGLDPNAGPSSTPWYSAYIAAEENPEMEQIYDLWLSTYLNQVGGAEVNAYNYTGAPGAYGAYGVEEYTGQPNAPKYDGMVDYLSGVPEPTTLAVLCPASLLALSRRRRVAAE